MTHPPRISDLARGRIARLSSMARAGVGMTGAVLAGSTAGIERAADVLGTLRGLGTKVGQMSTLVESGLAPDVRARVAPALGRLRSQVARSEPAAVRALLEAELGRPATELFASFAAEPFASASLGQVHRARTHGGQDVAVKIQHPGIADALRADLANVSMFASLATAMMLPSEAGETLMAAVRDGFEAELDYRAEASAMHEFRVALAGDPDVRIPEVFPEVSSARVLTTAFVVGDSVEALRASPAPIKRRAAQAVRRFVMRNWLADGRLYADPHAGNWLFHADGAVTVIDFGSVVRFDADELVDLRAQCDALRAGDDASFDALVRRVHEPSNDAIARALVASEAAALRPLLVDAPVGDDAVRAILDATRELKRAMFRGRMKVSPKLPFTSRARLGTVALLAQIG